MRERVPLVFMALSVAATLALGGAIAWEFTHQGRTTTAQPAAASTTFQPSTAAVKGKTHSSSGSIPSGSVAASGSPTAQNASAASPSGGSAHTKRVSSTGAGKHSGSHPERLMPVTIDEQDPLIRKADGVMRVPLKAGVLPLKAPAMIG